MQKTPSYSYSCPEPEEPASGLFDSIICAIKDEKDRRQTKKTLLLFFVLLLVSLVSLPFSYALFLHQWQESGIYYFILLAVSHLGLFFTFWQDFVFSILEA
ncbi:MAG: hypothetical protein ACHQVK_01085, partial [Candidatus Paceibacterales bacterium]